MIGLYQVRSREKAAATSQAGTSPHKLQLHPRSSAFICGHHVFPNCAQNAQVCTKWLRFVKPEPAREFVSDLIRVHPCSSVAHCLFPKGSMRHGLTNTEFVFSSLARNRHAPPTRPQHWLRFAKNARVAPRQPYRQRHPKNPQSSGTLRHPARIWLRFAKMPLRVTTLPQGSSFFRVLHIPLRPRVLPLTIPRK